MEIRGRKGGENKGGEEEERKENGKEKEGKERGAKGGKHVHTNVYIKKHLKMCMYLGSYPL